MSLKPEQVAHINIVNWFDYNFPNLSEDLIHIANERRCSIQEGVILKRMRVTKGAFDFHLAIPSKKYHGYWLELKVGKNKPTKEQLLFAERKISRGYDAQFAYGEEEAKRKIMTYLVDCVIE